MKTFKLSRDPKFLEKLTDVVGLYLNPPQQAIMLCVDEKRQIQALDRTQPTAPSNYTSGDFKGFPRFARRTGRLVAVWYSLSGSMPRRS